MQGSRTHERSGSTTSLGSAAKGEHREPEGRGRSKSPADDGNQGPPLARKVKSGTTDQYSRPRMKYARPELLLQEASVTVERNVYRRPEGRESARIMVQRMRGPRASTGRREAGDERSVAKAARSSGTEPGASVSSELQSSCM